MKAKLQRLAALSTVAVFTAVPAVAQTVTAQPDVTDVVAYMIAGIGTIALVGNAKLIVRGAMAVFRWAGSMIR
ncbi:MAG: major capsid protein [Hydrogenophaga sp.]